MNYHIIIVYGCKSIEAELGISSEALDVIKSKVDEAKLKNITLFGCLIFDEIHIRKHIRLINGKLEGYIDFGGSFDNTENLPVAVKH